MADAMTSMAVIQTRAPIPTSDGDMPEVDHGESDESPAPAPSARRIRPSAAATTAPAAIAVHEAAECDPSFFPTNAKPCASVARTGSMALADMTACLGEVNDTIISNQRGRVIAVALLSSTNSVAPLRQNQATAAMRPLRHVVQAA